MIFYRNIFNNKFSAKITNILIYNVIIGEIVYLFIGACLIIIAKILLFSYYEVIMKLLIIAFAN